MLKNELKAVKVASQQAVSATLNDMSGAPCGVLAPPDSHLNSRGLEVSLGGEPGGLDVPQGGGPMDRFSIGHVFPVQFFERKGK